MTLSIETFKNADLSQGWRPGNNAGGATLFKALGHPVTAPKARALVERLAGLGPVAVYDPQDMVSNFHAYYDLSALELEGYYVQRVEDLDKAFLGEDAKSLGALQGSRAKAVLVLLFDAEKLLGSLRHLLPQGAEIVTLDDIRLPDDMLTNRANYLDPMNFATNFALVRDLDDEDGGDGLWTEITSANYWGLHGAQNPELYLCLFAGDGSVLEEWREPLPLAGAPFTISSRELRARFGLGEIEGSLFIHALRIKGHDVVKYALDVKSSDGRALTCSHDANAWPADYYAGMPAGEDDEDVTLFIQNSHPMPIPAGSIGLNVMGSQHVAWYRKEVAPFATHAIDVATLLPNARWPDQIEIVAGRYFVRPRYEVARSMGQRRLAHANVERTDLKPDPNIPGLAATMGKGYIMPLPVLPREEFASVHLPTPMAREQHELPIRAELYDGDGTLVDSRYMGRLARRESKPVDIDDWIRESGKTLPSGFGHLEFLYDFRDGGEADGWLHALGRFEQRASGHRAETIFGAHIYNTGIIYKDEPQSYTNKPPGLTTRLFLRLGSDGLDTMCHLIYPASTSWHPKSSTKLILHDGRGKPIAERDVQIACGGSLFWRLSEMFTQDERAGLADGGYVIIRDTICRLFGFHGLLKGEMGFSFDHMFGF